MPKPIPPALGLPVSTRSFSMNEMARRAWGSEFSAPDHGIYMFSNGRRFDSTDMGVTGFYRHGFEPTPPPGVVGQYTADEMDLRADNTFITADNNPTPGTYVPPPPPPPPPTVVVPLAPTAVMALLQGQTTANSSTYNPTSNDYIPQNANVLSFGFTQGVETEFPIVRNNIYRSINGSDYTYYDFLTSGTTYSDFVAAACVGYPAGSGPNYYVGNGYCYKITAVDSQGNESLQSAPMILPYIINGAGIMNAGSFNGSPVYNNTTGPMQPGHTKNLLLTNDVGAFYLINPYAGNGADQYNLNVRSYPFLYFDVAPLQAGKSFQASCLRVGDVAIQRQGGGQLQIFSTDYVPSFPAGQYTTWRIPLADLMTDWTSGVGVLQTAWYKMNFQQSNGVLGDQICIDNMYFSPV